MNMKKQYIKPQTEMEFIAIPNLMGHSNNMAEAKENSFDEEEDTSFDRIKNIEFQNVWEDEEDED